MRTRTYIWLLLTLPALPLAASQVTSDLTLSPTYDGPVLVDNTRFLYTGEDRLSFGTAEYLAAHHPGLEPLRPAIDTWASQLGVHPRLLAEMAAARFGPSRLEASAQEIAEVVRLAAALAEVFHAAPQEPLAASRAVRATADALGFALDLPADFATPRRLPRAVAGGPPLLFGYLQPPFEIGDTWAGSGAHGTTGSGLQNSLDFWGEFRPWSGDVSAFWVAATQSGTARVWSACGLAVVHGNGWVTDYYHLDDIQVADFETVERNTRLSHYANTEAQALCQGGSSTGPHVHMAITFNGQRVLVDQSQLDFTVFSHHVGEGQYDSNCTRSWYDHLTVGRICPNFDQLANNATPPPAEDILIDGFEDGDLDRWTQREP